MKFLELARLLSKLTPERPCTKARLRQAWRAGQIQATLKHRPLSRLSYYEIPDEEVERIKAIWLEGN